MKLRFKILAGLALMISSMTYAQVDRSQMPEEGPAPQIKMGKPKSFTLKNGAKVLVVENHKLPKVSLSISLDNPIYSEGNKVGISSLTSAMLAQGTQNMSKDEFNEEVDFLGASLRVAPQSASASGLSKYKERIFELLADAALNPKFTQEELDFQRKQALDGLKSGERSAASVAGRVRKVLAYGEQHPYAEYETEESLKNVSLEDVKQFYAERFVPEKAYILVSGDIKYREAKKIVKELFGDWKGAAPAPITFDPAKDVDQTEVNFIDMPNAVQAELFVANTVDLKMSHPDYHPVLIMNYILGGAFGSYLNMNLREEHGWTYGINSRVATNKNTTTLFTAAAKVRNAVVDSSVVEIAKEIRRIRDTEVSDKDLLNAKNMYTGNFIMAFENPGTMARYAITTQTQNLPEDFYATFTQKLQNVTKSDVQRVAQKYLKPENLRFVVVAKGSEAIVPLENMKIEGAKVPVKFYDKFGKAVARPELSKPIPAGLTAQMVLDNYFNALGGKEKLKSLSSLHMRGTMNMMGTDFGMELKQMLPNMERSEISHPQAGVIMTSVFDGEKGYVIQQGRKIDMPQEQLMEKKSKPVFIPELAYGENYKLELKKIAMISSTQAYQMEVTNPNGKVSSRFYSVKDGLLIREEQKVNVDGQEILVYTNYYSYKKVQDILFPTSLESAQGEQKMKVELSEILVNSGMTNKDFM